MDQRKKTDKYKPKSRAALDVEVQARYGMAVMKQGDALSKMFRAIGLYQFAVDYTTLCAAEVMGLLRRKGKR